MKHSKLLCLFTASLTFGACQNIEAVSVPRQPVATIEIKDLHLFDKGGATFEFDKGGLASSEAASVTFRGRNLGPLPSHQEKSLLMKVGITKNGDLNLPVNGEKHLIHQPAVLDLNDGKRAFICGGIDTAQNSKITDNVWLVNYVTQKLIQLSDMSIKRSGHQLTLLPSQRVLISGGQTSADGDVTNSCEIYDLDRRTTSPTASMHVARFNHSTLALPDGMILIVSGETTHQNADSGLSMTSTMELFNPQEKRFLKGDRINAARLNAQLIYLGTDGVLICGGWRDDYAEIPSPELYRINL